jgi:hypothetical protein
VIAMPRGFDPTAIVAPAVPAARSTTRTEPGPNVTYAVLPSGAIAMPRASAPTLTAVPLALVAMVIGVTSPAVSTT